MRRSRLLGVAIYSLAVLSLCPLLNHHRPDGLAVYPHLFLAHTEPSSGSQVLHTHEGTSRPEGGDPPDFVPFEAAPGLLGLIGLALLAPFLALPIAPLPLHPLWLPQGVAFHSRNPSPQPRPPTR